MENKYKTPLFLFTVYILISPLIYNYIAEYRTIPLTAVLCIVSAVLLSFKNRVSITPIDITIVSLFIYQIGNIALLRHWNVDGLIYHEWLLMGAIYFLSKLVCSKYGNSFVLTAIVISGSLQGIIAILQDTDIISSTNDTFKMTGSFNNPGLLGGYLAVSLTAAIYSLLHQHTTIQKIGYIISSALIGSILLLSDSRAGWTAVITASLYMFYKSHFFALVKSTYKRWLNIGIATLCISIAVIFYYHKKESANVRLFIWEIGTAMFVEAPFCGHGIGSFSIQYMPRQGEHFKHNPHSKNILLSDNRNQSFNEPLTILCEQGIIGILFILFIFVKVFCNTTKKSGVHHSLFSLCIFSCFSYPNDVLPLKILFPLLIGSMSFTPIVILPKREKANTKSYIYAPIIIGLSLIFTVSTIKRYEAAFADLQNNNPNIILPYNKKFMARYLSLLIERNNYTEFIARITDKDFPFMTSVLQCDLGVCYMHLQKFKKAEAAFYTAYWMVPSKVLPKYRLFILYQNTNRHIEAREKAEEIIRMQNTPVGTTYLRARTEAKNYLLRHEKQEFNESIN